LNDCQNVFWIALLLVLGFALDGNPRFHWTATSLFCLLYLAVIGSASLRVAAAHDGGKAASNLAHHPAGAVMLGWAIGGETFSMLSLIGGCFVLAGVWMIFRKGEVREPVIQEG
jgi:drug/metabolite transporter (DMT)-like permease